MTPDAPTTGVTDPEAAGPATRRGRLQRGALLGAVLVVLAGGGVGVMTGFLPNPVTGDPKAGGQDIESAGPTRSTGPQTVKVIRPKQDPSVQVTAEQLATVEPYYRADLRARASGLVTAVHKDIGDRVRQGDVLVEISVPDLTEDVAQKDAVVGQRQQELRVSQANVADAEAGVVVADAVVREKQALVTQAEATRDFRSRRLGRLRRLAATDSVTAGVIDEEERDAAAAAAAVTAAQAGVERARADKTQAASKIEAAKADIDLQVALVEVARRDRDKARAVADFARVVAPFDGVVIRRTVDPGSFVQNATTGTSEPLVSVVRTDLVSVVARFTDSVAPFVTADTQAEISLDALPGVTVGGRVTRFSPAIQATDRTVRVEVDLFNGDEADRLELVGRVMAARLAALAAVGPFGPAASQVAGRQALAGLHKGDGDLWTVGSFNQSAGDGPGRLLPGMSGTMKLALKSFRGGYVLPSTAVYSRGGKPYILVADGGATKQLPVRVQVNDGRVAQVSLVARRKDATGGVRDVLTELTGQELVVAGRQLELGEGLAVNPAVSDW